MSGAERQLAGLPLQVHVERSRAQLHVPATRVRRPDQLVDLMQDRRQQQRNVVDHRSRSKRTVFSTKTRNYLDMLTTEKRSRPCARQLRLFRCR